MRSPCGWRHRPLLPTNSRSRFPSTRRCHQTPLLPATGSLAASPPRAERTRMHRHPRVILQGEIIWQDDNRDYLVIGRSSGKTARARTDDGAITLFEPGLPRMYRVDMEVA